MLCFFLLLRLALLGSPWSSVSLADGFGLSDGRTYGVLVAIHLPLSFASHTDVCSPKFYRLMLVSGSHKQLAGHLVLLADVRRIACSSTMVDH